MMIEPSIYEDFDTSVLQRLRSLRLRLRQYLVLSGLLPVIVAGLIWIVGSLLVDRTFRLSLDMRIVQLLSLAAVSTIVFWRLVWKPIRTDLAIAELAMIIEHRFPQLNGRLVTAVDFALCDQAAPSIASSASGPMVQQVFIEASEQSRSLPLETVLDHGRAWRRGSLVVACVAVVVTFSVAMPETMAVWFQRNVLLQQVDWPRRHQLIVEALENDTLTVPRGEDLVVSAIVPPGFVPPRQVFLHMANEAGKRARKQMIQIQDRQTRFTCTLEQMAESWDCTVTGGDARHTEFRIDVVDRPQVDTADITIFPPAYTQLEPSKLRQGQAVVETLRGSRLRMSIQASKPLYRAVILRQSAKEEASFTPTISDGSNFVFEDQPARSCTYTIQLEDEIGLTNTAGKAKPTRILLQLRPDEPPAVKMQIKGVGDMITQEAVLPVNMDFADPYGLAEAALVIQEQREPPVEMREPVDGLSAGTKSFTAQRDWRVAGHGFEEGDRIVLFAQAHDLDDINGPNVGKSLEYSFRIVGREELIAELNRQERNYRQDFERLVRRQDQLFADLLTLRQQIDQLDDQQEFDKDWIRLARRQRDQTGRLSTLMIQFEQLLAEMRTNDLSTPENESRLREGIIQPSRRILEEMMPRAAELLEEASRDDDLRKHRAAQASQQEMVDEMNRVLEQMIQWEWYQEAVIMLQNILRMQRNVHDETELRIESELFGAEPDANEPTP